ncbi:MAG: EscU/YscU/HrcU family type III secretion system export apparatus switch protein [Myxococcota bacterium]
MSTEKQLPATPDRLREARRKGDLPRSRAWGALGALAGGGLPLLMRPNPSSWQVLARRTLGLAQDDAGVAWLCFGMAELAPPLVGASLGALLGGLAVGGWAWAPAALQLRFERLYPSRGAKRLVEPKLWADGLRDLAWVTIVLLALSWTLSRPGLLTKPGLGVALMAALTWVLGVPWAVLDGLWSTRAHARRHRMSLQDLKEETKRREGDPRTKQERRQRGRQLVQESLQQRVESATVVLVNPIHLAVALAHDPTSAEPPLVAARGRDAEASRIRGIARRAGVPIIRNVALARRLHRLDEAEPIPEALYGPVAGVLCQLLIDQEAE